MLVWCIPSFLHSKYSLFLCCKRLIFFSSLNLQEVKVFTYENSAKHKTEKDAIAEVQTRGCYAQQKQAYTMNIEVPPTSPTDVTTSKIVHVRYYLKVSHNLSHFTKLVHVCLFVLFGLFGMFVFRFCLFFVPTVHLFRIISFAF